MLNKPNDRLVAGLILFVVLIGAYLVLAHVGADTGPVMLFGGPIVTYLILGSKVDKNFELAAGERADLGSTLADQNTVLTTITRQTNGELDRRIRHAAEAAVIAQIDATTATLTTGTETGPDAP